MTAKSSNSSGEWTTNSLSECSMATGSSVRAISLHRRRKTICQSALGRCDTQQNYLEKLSRKTICQSALGRCDTQQHGLSTFLLLLFLIVTGPSHKESKSCTVANTKHLGFPWSPSRSGSAGMCTNNVNYGEVHFSWRFRLNGGISVWFHLCPVQNGSPYRPVALEPCSPVAL
eukprot:1183217-Prorocentrum_minimum.AAC.3